MNWGRAFVSGITGGVVLNALGFIDYSLFKGIYESPELQAITLEPSSTAWIVVDLLWGIILGLVYAMVGGSLHGGLVAKAVKFGGIAWLFGLVYIVFNHMLFPLPESLLYVELIGNFVYPFGAGLAIAAIYKEKGPKPGASAP